MDPGASAVPCSGQQGRSAAGPWNSEPPAKRGLRCGPGFGGSRNCGRLERGGRGLPTQRRATGAPEAGDLAPDSPKGSVANCRSATRASGKRRDRSFIRSESFSTCFYRGLFRIHDAQTTRKEFRAPVTWLQQPSPLVPPEPPPLITRKQAGPRHGVHSPKQKKRGFGKVLEASRANLHLTHE